MGHKKEYAVYAHENDDNFRRPLYQVMVHVNMLGRLQLLYAPFVCVATVALRWSARGVSIGHQSKVRLEGACQCAGGGTSDSRLQQSAFFKSPYDC